MCHLFHRVKGKQILLYKIHNKTTANDVIHIHTLGHINDSIAELW